MAHRSGNRQKHESSNPLQRRLLDNFHDEVRRLLQQVDPDAILDLGCGEGYVLDALLERGIDCELTGIDFSGSAIAAARERLGQRAHLFEGDVTTLETDTGPFDVVMMLEVLEHLEDPSSALSLLRSLTTNAVVVSVPWEPFFRGLNLLRFKNVKRWGSDPEHVQHWTKKQFESLVSERFDIVDRGRAFPWTLLLLRPKDAS